MHVTASSVLALTTPSLPRPNTAYSAPPIYRCRAPLMAYDNSNNEPAYDLAAPSFDFLELRSYRRESILQYSLTYRTEQLRILFFGSSALVGLFFP